MSFNVISFRKEEFLTREKNFLSQNVLFVRDVYSAIEVKSVSILPTSRIAFT